MIPEAIECESIVLAACFATGAWRRQVLARLTASDFHDPRNAMIFDAIVRVNEHESGGVWRAIFDAVLTELGEEGLRRIGGLDYLEWVDRQTPVTVTAYINVLAGAGDRRKLMHVLEAAATDIRDPDANLGNLTATLARDLEDVVRPDFVPSMSAEQFLAVDDDAYDWLIPGLLEATDRVIWTAGEGIGKSTLQTQLAVMAAAGLHPFKRYPIRAVRVLYVDLENTARQTRRTLRGLHERVQRAGREPGVLEFVPARPDGLDLRTPKDFGWLDRQCDRVKPDLLVIGPVYKCFRTHGRESKADETAAEECAYAFDRIRDRYGCAMSLEAHSPHGESGDRAGLRPYGASLWLRWPEFGYGLKRIAGEPYVEVVPWRGPRDRDRDWPEKLYYGTEWPWEAGEV